jgi:hypothetical protein
MKVNKTHQNTRSPPGAPKSKHNQNGSDVNPANSKGVIAITRTFAMVITQSPSLNHEIITSVADR